MVPGKLESTSILLGGANFYEILLVLLLRGLPSDNQCVQHDLQHGSLIIFPKEENLGNKGLLLLGLPSDNVCSISFHVDLSKHSWREKSPYTKDNYAPSLSIFCVYLFYVFYLRYSYYVLFLLPYIPFRRSSVGQFIRSSQMWTRGYPILSPSYMCCFSRAALKRYSFPTTNQHEFTRQISFHSVSFQFSMLAVWMRLLTFVKNTPSICCCTCLLLLCYSFDRTCIVEIGVNTILWGGRLQENNSFCALCLCRHSATWSLRTRGSTRETERCELSHSVVLAVLGRARNARDSPVSGGGTVYWCFRRSSWSTYQRRPRM